MAVMSGKVYSDVGVPSNTYGADGDIYMRLDGLKTTYRKEGGIWTPIGSQVGAIPEFLKGNDAPDNALGEDNQYYREVSTGKVYEKQSGVWTEVGAWTSLEVQTLLQQSGLGVDLGGSNYILNIDAFTTAGGEGYFGTVTAGTKPTTGIGLCRAWRVDASKVYQEAHTSDNKWLTRLTTDGGATWTGWQQSANVSGDAAQVFKAATAEEDSDVVNLELLLASLFNFERTSTSNEWSIELGDFTLKVGKHHIGDLAGGDPTYTVSFDTPFTILSSSLISPYSLGGVGTNRFFMHKFSEDETGITVIAAETESAIQNCGFTYIAFGVT